MLLLKAYIVLLSVISFLIWLIFHSAKEPKNKTVDVSPEIYNWMHVEKSYWVCEECESELGDRKAPCIDCGFETEKYRVKSKRTRKAS